MSATENQEDHAEDRALGPVDRVVLFFAVWVGGPVLGFLVMITIVDVTMRYVFNSPIFGAEDFSSLSLSILVATAIAYSGRTGGQVAVELFTNLMKPSVTVWTDLIVRLISIAMLILMGWQLVIAGLDAAKYGETSFALLISLEPFFYILAGSMFLYALVLAAEIVFHYRADGQEQQSDL